MFCVVSLVSAVGTVFLEFECLGLSMPGCFLNGLFSMLLCKFVFCVVLLVSEVGAVLFEFEGLGLSMPS